MNQAFIGSQSLSLFPTTPLHPYPFIHMWDPPFYILWFHPSRCSPFVQDLSTKSIAEKLSFRVLLIFFAIWFFIDGFHCMSSDLKRLSQVFPMKLRRITLKCLVPQMRKVIECHCFIWVRGLVKESQLCSSVVDDLVFMVSQVSEKTLKGKEACFLRLRIFIKIYVYYLQKQ